MYAEGEQNSILYLFIVYLCYINLGCPPPMVPTPLMHTRVAAAELGKQDTSAVDISGCTCI